MKQSKLEKYSIPYSEVKVKMTLSKEEERFIQEEKNRIIFTMQLKEARKNMHLTQKMLSELSGIPQETISRIESGKRNTTLDNIIILSNFLGKTLSLT